ncbi:MAG: hypothetical protein HC933_03055 [Pleurocapsa sp. SU_196_0]|nr:hypothetical protein [Pleurocapsa sp. SU_196_0]
MPPSLAREIRQALGQETDAERTSRLRTAYRHECILAATGTLTLGVARADDGLARRKGDRMHKAVELRPMLAKLRKQSLDLGVLGNVAVKGQYGAEFGRRFGHALLEALALVAERQLGAFAVAGAGNAIGQRAVVQNAGDQQAFVQPEIPWKAPCRGSTTSFCHGCCGILRARLLQSTIPPSLKTPVRTVGGFQQSRPFFMVDRLLHISDATRTHELAASH